MSERLPVIDGIARIKNKTCRNILTFCYQVIGITLISLLYLIMIIFRFIFQTIEFYFIIILTNIIIEFNIIFTYTLYKYNKNSIIIMIISFIFNVIFNYISVNFLTIYYYEFSQLTWINFETTKEGIIPAILKKEKNESMNKYNLVPSEKDIFPEYNDIPSYIFIFFAVIIIYIIFEVNEFAEFIYFFLFFSLPFTKLGKIYSAVLFSKYKKVLIPKYKFPFLEFIDFYPIKESLFYKLTNKDGYNSTVKFIFIAICFLFNIIILIINKESYPTYIFVTFIYLSCGGFFINLQIEPWFFYLREKGRNDSCLSCQNYCYCDSELLNKNKTLRRCNKIVTLIYFIPLLLLLIIDYDILINNANVNRATVQNTYNKTKNFTGHHWLRRNITPNHNVISPICYTKNNYLNYIQLTSLASAVYLEGEMNQEKNIINALKLSVFNEIDDNINLKNLSFLTNNSDIIPILKIDFEIKGKQPLTIISIQGTSNYLDFFLDVEMFITSSFFTFAKKIPLPYKNEAYISYYFTSNCLLSFDYLGGITLTKAYFDTINSKFQELNNTAGYRLNERRYLFVGHSLGGGLAKLMGFKHNQESFSVSGPGLTPLEFYLGFGKDIYKKYFNSTFIDIVPDLDIVPRVDLSGGAQYRVLCEKGIFKCHNVERTLCMIGVMCNMEHLTGDLCSGIFSNKEYEDDFIKVEESKY